MATSSEAQLGKGAHKRDFNTMAETDNANVNLVREQYNPLLEDPADSVTLSKEYKEWGKGIVHMKKILTDPFDQSNYSDKLTEDTKKYVQDHFVMPKHEEIICGLFGRMGVGKSGTLNSLLSVGAIGREGGSGHSVTLACMFYCGTRKDQKEVYLAEVTFFSSAECYDILAYYVRAYYQAVNGEKELLEEQKAAGRAIEVEDLSEENAAIRTEVEKTFLSLFRDKKECRTMQDVRSLLETARTEDDELVLSKVNTWTDELVQKVAGQGDSVIVTASTVNDLQSRLEPYTTQVNPFDDTAEPSYSPIVSSIRYHFNNPLTRDGLTLLDTPGTSDPVVTRRMSAMKYARTKTHAILLLEAMRAGDDPDIVTDVKALNALGPNRLIVVMTKTDNIDKVPDETMFTREDKATSRELKTFIEIKKTLLENARTAHASYDGNSIEDFRRLGVEVKRAEIGLKHAENAEPAFRIRQLNDRLATALQEKLKTLTSATMRSHPIPVLGISNSLYQVNTDGFDPIDKPILNAQQTNIPKLRGKIGTLQNEARLNEVRHAQDVVFPSLLNRMLLLTSRSPVERKADVEVHIFRAAKCGESVVGDTFAVLADDLLKVIMTPLQQMEPSFNQNSKKLCSRWDTEFPTRSFMALMEQSGRRRGTKNKSRSVDLTAELLSAFSEAVNGVFTASSPNHNKFEAALRTAMDSLVSGMITDLREDPNFAFSNSEEFLEYLSGATPQLRKMASNYAVIVLQGLDHISKKASSVSDDAYITIAMNMVYQQVRILKGGKNGLKTKPPAGGYAPARKRKFRESVTLPKTVWTAIMRAIKKDITELLDGEKMKMKRDVGKVFLEVKKTFDLRCDVRPDAGPEEKDLQDKLRAAVKLAIDYHNTTQQARWKAINQKFAM